MVSINYTPQPGQTIFHESAARYRCLSCGRRWGKTLSAIAEFIRVLFQSENGAQGLWCSDIYKKTDKGWRTFFDICPKTLITRVNKAERVIQLRGNRNVWFASADRPESLESDEYDIVAMDEFPSMKREVWENSLRPTLLNREGKAIFIGTPKGKNWAYELWLRGDVVDADWDQWESFQFPTRYIIKLEGEEVKWIDHPWGNTNYVSLKELQDAFINGCGRSLLVWQQEYEGKFIDELGSVFTENSIRNCVKEIPPPPKIPNNNVVIGVDLAKKRDYTVAVVLDSDNIVKKLIRISPGTMEWPDIWNRIKQIHDDWFRGLMIIDSTGVGDPSYDELALRGVSIYPFHIKNNRVKKDLILNLQMKLENGEVTIPDGEEMKPLLNELRSYSYKQSPSGVLKYEAPSGFHDDCVIALALAVWKNRIGSPADAIAVY